MVIKQQIQFTKKRFTVTISAVVCSLLLAFAGCKKADQFYNKLDNLLQVDASAERAYRTTYVVGDTLTIQGLLKASQNLEIWINGTKGEIIARDSVRYQTSERVDAHMDKVQVLISDSMIGNNLPVVLKNGTLSGQGPAIDVLSYYGEDSFDKELTHQLLYTIPDRNNIFLHCASGKGDIFYYSSTDKLIRHVAKDGTASVLFDLSSPLPDGSVMQSFLAGGLDPAMRDLYFSIQTDQGNSLYRFSVANRQLSLLNQSAAIAEPYTGKLSEVGIVVTGIYPDAEGNIYLYVGAGQSGNALWVSPPQALGRYSAADGSFTYLYKWDSQLSSLPAELFSSGELHRALRINPVENRFYIASYNNFTFATTLEEYDLTTRTRLQGVTMARDLSGGDQFRFVSNFLSLKIDVGGGINPDLCFGLMPMPGRKLQTLLFQFYNVNNKNVSEPLGFPKWTVFDFESKRTYAYAQGRYDRGAYVYNPTQNLFPRNNTIDELLNWDEDGHLYMSANGRKVLLKTQTK